MESQNTLQKLQSRGYKLTKVRKFIINLVTISKKPLSAQEILAQLTDIGMKVNKTTVYRELTFLLKENVVKEVLLSDETKRYEATQSTHHHHLVCKNCQRVDEVDSVTLEKELSGLQKYFSNQKDFRMIDHSLEFFGLCRQCA